LTSYRRSSARNKRTRTGKRDSANTDDFVQDLRERVIGIPEISTDGFHPYKPAIRDAFNRASHDQWVQQEA